MCTSLQSKIKTLKFFLLAVSSSFPEMTFEDAGDVGGDGAGEMGSPLGTERCLTFNTMSSVWTSFPEIKGVL